MTNIELRDACKAVGASLGNASKTVMMANYLKKVAELPVKKSASSRKAADDPTQGAALPSDSRTALSSRGSSRASLSSAPRVKTQPETPHNVREAVMASFLKPSPRVSSSSLNVSDIRPMRTPRSSRGTAAVSGRTSSFGTPLASRAPGGSFEVSDSDRMRPPLHVNLVLSDSESDDDIVVTPAPPRSRSSVSRRESYAASVRAPSSVRREQSGAYVAASPAFGFSRIPVLHVDTAVSPVHFAPERATPARMRQSMGLQTDETSAQLEGLVAEAVQGAVERARLQTRLEELERDLIQTHADVESVRSEAAAQRSEAAAQSKRSNELLRQKLKLEVRLDHVEDENGTLRAALEHVSYQRSAWLAAQEERLSRIAELEDHVHELTTELDAVSLQVATVSKQRGDSGDGFREARAEVSGSAHDVDDDIVTMGSPRVRSQVKRIESWLAENARLAASEAHRPDSADSRVRLSRSMTTDGRSADAVITRHVFDQETGELVSSEPAVVVVSPSRSTHPASLSNSAASDNERAELRDEIRPLESERTAWLEERQSLLSRLDAQLAERGAAEEQFEKFRVFSEKAYGKYRDTIQKLKWELKCRELDDEQWQESVQAQANAEAVELRRQLLERDCVVKELEARTTVQEQQIARRTTELNDAYVATFELKEQATGIEDGWKAKVNKLEKAYAIEKQLSRQQQEKLNAVIVRLKSSSPRQ
eukprot:TRINITY_DN11923_c0_g1_i1.p1 TRINITY_DN11923_c0_g1~~TRINITY_DN11923_c0_g1_i1.p1  ORF type:complete len:709 (-),score=231.45 TRINITY_DN11923_c0_g1_i1:86-2212(-)